MLMQVFVVLALARGARQGERDRRITTAGWFSGREAWHLTEREDDALGLPVPHNVMRHTFERLLKAGLHCRQGCPCQISRPAGPQPSESTPVRHRGV